MAAVTLRHGGRQLSAAASRSASCGDSVIDPGETCDPPASCPIACDDGIGCTVDALIGSAANCNAVCSQVAIVSCSGGDGWCPAGCDEDSDADCTCGNSALDPGETCDPPASCPTACDDGDPCTVDALGGSPETCDVSCASSPVTACVAGDSCCPAGCDEDGDADCQDEGEDGADGSTAGDADGSCACAAGARGAAPPWLLLLGLPLVAAGLRRYRPAGSGDRSRPRQ